MSPEDRRANALDYAVKTMQGCPYPDVLRAAEAYEAYLKGRDPDTNVKTGQSPSTPVQPVKKADW
jgi:hypothetical protein